jgi:hypothetical protein
MKSKNALFRLSKAVVLQLGMLAGSAQNSIHLFNLFSMSETIITVKPGAYIIAAYGAGGGVGPDKGKGGGLGRLRA